MKTSTENIRIGIIGVGNMGVGHARNLQEGKVPGGQLAAVVDSIPANLEPWKDVAKFSSIEELIKAKAVDAVVIVTPHFSHAPLAIAAFNAGLHVLVEKPLTVRKSDAEQIIAAHKKTDRVFGIVFNQRTDPLYRQMHQWINDGTLGPIQRVQWTTTDWFRSEAYYKSGSWRGTWAGEGGGVLVNQSPHQIDLWQWLFGMPVRARAVGGMGKYHSIEVEDDVTAIFEYANGMTGVFVTTTGESPGVNRLEVAGDNGLAILEGRTLRFIKNDMPTQKFSRTITDKFSRPTVKEEEPRKYEDNGPQHLGILINFVEAIREGKLLIAPGAEGIRSLELANAMITSIVDSKVVDLPMNAAEFDRVLDGLIKKNKKA